ncbi:MAG TPA: tripartite tricarboxylate transporter substrate binding protein [Xanthobacteraceae bacterium]|nr:tripartite tricarboxylate transporter substrate binding protein [Xanthobacteraceae bacterium]
MTRKTTRKIIAALVLMLAPLLLGESARAYPDRPIKLIVTSPAGGPPDIIARLISDRMAAGLGQPVVVENRTGGAGGTIGAKSILAAEPDGYTLMMGSTSSLLIAPLIYKNAGYTAETFAPVAGVSETTEVLTVHPSVNATSVAELIKLAKSEPGALRYGSAGVGTLPHLEGELLKARAQIDISHIPYRGGGPALTGLLGGEVHIFFSALTQMLPYIRDGRLRGLAVTSEARSALAPELPTMVESGFDQFVTASINFLVAPPGTPMPIRRQVSDAVARALASEELKQAFARIGAQARPASPEELSAYIARQQQLWTRIVETTKISVE